MRKIYVAGHGGLVGSALTRAIDAKADLEWFGASRIDLDLLDRNKVFEYVFDTKPDSVIVAAAKVGGIVANNDFPVDFLSENLQIQTNLIDAAHNAQIRSLIFLGSSCIYPKFSEQPINEESLLTGPLEPTNEPYAIAKIAGIKLVQAYRKQFGYKWISAMPTNLYGPGDNFDLNSSHVLPALIRKFHEAKVNGKTVEPLWGTGSPRREFLHVDDLASGVLHLLDGYDAMQPINIGTGYDISIKDLADLVARVIGYSGEIHWDSNRPDGTPRKLLDISRILETGWQPTIELGDGIESTYEWFKSSFSPA
jgi:GDP-L-fucose synthase